MLEDRPPSNEERYAITVDLLKLWREFKGEQYDSYEHPCGDYCTSRLSEIDKRIDAAIAGAARPRNGSGEEESGS
jgi:hypothetical protein